MGVLDQTAAGLTFECSHTLHQTINQPVPLLGKPGNNGRSRCVVVKSLTLNPGVQSSLRGPINLMEGIVRPCPSSETL